MPLDIFINKDGSNTAQAEDRSKSCPWLLTPEDKKKAAADKVAADKARIAKLKEEKAAADAQKKKEAEEARIAKEAEEARIAKEADDLAKANSQKSDNNLPND